VNDSASPFGSLAEGVKLYAWFTSTEDGGVPLMTGGEFTTVIENAGNDADTWPSETVITMFGNVPAVPGVPLILPVLPLNVAQAGRPLTVNVSVSPLGSLAVGVKLYACPLPIEPGGVPLITGGKLGTKTWIANAGSVADAWPSETLMTMLANTPAVCGVPLS
jgi:hypothetical protein